MTALRRTFAPLALLCAGLCSGLWAGTSQAEPVQAGPFVTPVVVELFTSQGCSACPPADALLAQLGDLEGVQPLALHVDYWDYIGWRDQFGARAHTRRQKGYARTAGWRTIYTPQIVVNGVQAAVGSNAMSVNALIHEAMMAPRAVDLEVVPSSTGYRVSLRRSGVGVTERSDIHIVRYAEAEEVMIPQGENAGRSLTYTHIVTDWDVLDQWDGEDRYSRSIRIEGDAPAVLLVQGVGYGPIFAAARLR